MRNGFSASSNGRHSRKGHPVLITGGAGFIGANLADRLLTDGEDVVLYDNLSRAGVERNYEWLRERHGEHVTLEEGDTTDLARLTRVVRNAAAVYHFAAQVAVTTSIGDPRHDFQV